MSGKLIVMLSTRVHPEPGGVAKFAYFLAKHVRNENFETCVVSCRPHGVILTSCSPDLRFLPISFPKDLSKRNLFSQFVASVTFFLTAFVELLRIRRRKTIRLIHANSPAICGLVAATFGFLFRVPFVYTIHGMEVSNSFESIVQEIVFRSRMSSLSAVSRSIKRTLEKRGVRKRVRLIPNGVEVLKNGPDHASPSEKPKELERLGIPGIQPDSLIVLYVGLMQFKQKVRGMVDFLRAFDQFLSATSFPGAHRLRLVFVGDGPYRSFLEDAKDRVINGDRVVIAGYRTDVKRLFRVADLSALTSYVEGSPTVVLESMAAGVPCIGTSVGEVGDMIGSSGFIVSPGDVEGMTRVLHAYYSDERKRTELKEASYRRVKERFDWKVVAAKVRKMYQSKISRR